jgi:SEC-C motif
MNFLDRIEPFLTTDDLIIQEFVVQALHDYPKVSKEWKLKLAAEAINNKEKTASILVYLAISPMDEEVADLLIEGALQAPIHQRHLFIQLFYDLAPELAIKYKPMLSEVIPNDDWVLYELLVNGSKERIWQEFHDITNKLEAEQPFPDASLYRRAKKIAYTIVKKGWITIEELDEKLHENVMEVWIDFQGILGVYMISLLKNDTYIQKLAPLLVRDEDLLLEEVAATLISFQSDEVVKAVAPYLVKEESSIFAASIIENIKTDYSLEVLRNAYQQTKQEDIKEIIFESLVHQLHPDAEKEINDFVSGTHHSYLIDVEQLAYSYYKIVGIDHPLSEAWRQSFLMKEEHIEEDNIPVQPIKQAKIGRNDPCPCGSGKKYKKCCG